MCDYANCIDRHVKALKALKELWDRVAEAIAVGSLPFSEWIESSLLDESLGISKPHTVL